MALGGRSKALRDLARQHSAEIIESSAPEDFTAAARLALAEPDRLLVLCGGDGTIQAVVTALAEYGEPEQFPRLLLLGGGRTNYTARDLATHARPAERLQQALTHPQQLEETVRHSLILRQSGQPDRHGFFVAGARINDVIRDCHAYRQRHEGWLQRGHASSAWRVSQLGLKAIFGRLDFPDWPAHIRADGLGELSGPVRLLLVTTLSHSAMRHDPYPERGSGPLRLTASLSDARAFWPRLPRLVSGRWSSQMDSRQGYLGGRCRSICLEGLAQVCLDGQEHDYAPDRALEILPGPPFRLLSA